MSKIIIDDRVISTNIETILREIRKQSGYTYFKSMMDKGNYIRCTCPFHKGGQEAHPSMSVFTEDNKEYKSGNYNCLTCGESGSLPKLVAHCLNLSVDASKKWLIDNFSTELLIQSGPEIELPDLEELNGLFNQKKEKYLNESILKNYEYYHPYMWKRKLSKEVVDKFHIGFDKNENAITFPVWDMVGRLVMITKRCVDSKRFMIPADVEKPVYLLNFAVKENIDAVYVCESQINALYCYSLGIPAIALFGTGSAYQYEILKSSGIKHFILAFDGDVAGRKGISKFIENMSLSSIIDIVVVPEGRDINDLTAEEIKKLPKYDEFEWTNKFKK